MTKILEKFPKIYRIGNENTKWILKYPVCIKEKIDGSQFGFGNLNGSIQKRSKNYLLGSELDMNGAFFNAVKKVEEIKNLIPLNHCFYCEYLKIPKHNKLKYARIPNGNLILFGYKFFDEESKTWFYTTEQSRLKYFSDLFGIECIPEFSSSFEIKEISQLGFFLKRESILGNANIEGIVVCPSYTPDAPYFDEKTFSLGKYLSKEFQETKKINLAEFSSFNKKIEIISDIFRTEARWNKAVQKLRDSGMLENSEKDIGKIIKEIQNDIIEEESEYIKKLLYDEFKRYILLNSVKGFSEWYKNLLFEKLFLNYD